MQVFTVVTDTADDSPLFYNKSIESALPSIIKLLSKGYRILLL